MLDRFHRLDSDRGPGDSGAGLGLSIVQAIVSAHRGTLEIGDAPAGGARVEISLPREPPLHGSGPTQR